MHLGRDVAKIPLCVFMMTFTTFLPTVHCIPISSTHDENTTQRRRVMRCAFSIQRHSAGPFFVLLFCLFVGTGTHNFYFLRPSCEFHMCAHTSKHKHISSHGIPSGRTTFPLGFDFQLHFCSIRIPTVLIKHGWRLIRAPRAMEEKRSCGGGIRQSRDATYSSTVTSANGQGDYQMIYMTVEIQNVRPISPRSTIHLDSSVGK